MTSTWRRPIPAALITLIALAGCTVEVPNQAETDAAVDKARGTPPTPSMPTVKPRPPVLLSSKKTDAPKVVDLIEEAIRSNQYNNLGAATASLEEALELDPNDRRALALLAQTTQRHASMLQRPDNSPLFLKSASAMRRLRAAVSELTKEDKLYMPQVFYNEACTLAIAGEPARAIKSLSEAIDAGLNDPAVLDADVELDSLRKLPEFQALQSKVERRGVEALMAASKPFAFDFKLNNLDGKPVTLADLKGEVTIVDFWGTWCPPCRKAMPHLVELSNKYKDKGVKVVGLAFEQESGDAAVKAVRDFVKKAGIPFPCLMGDEATQEKVPEFPGYPTTLFLDKTGKVRLKLSGYQSLGTFEYALKALLDEGKPKPAAKK